MPVNRAPFPTPENFPVYFSLQPGGAIVQGLNPDREQGVRVAYPNYDKSANTSKSNFFFYDTLKGWQIYGQGSLSLDKRHFVPDHRIAMNRFTSGSMTVPNTDDPPTETNLPNDADKCGCTGSGGIANAGDPIDLRTGNFLYKKTDGTIQDIMPISLSRVYRPHDARNRMFGIGTVSNYAYSLNSSANNNYDIFKLVLPNGSGMAFNRVGQASNKPGFGKWIQNESTGDFYGAVIESIYNNPLLGIGYRLTKNDGTIMFFESGGGNRLRFIENRNGRRINFVYDAGLLSRIVSPSGRYIQFSYNANNRVSTATDHTGRAWAYT
ncbi:MAG: DUF6531 domain-containing protein, partial [Methylococcales bacterium]